MFIDGLMEVYEDNFIQAAQTTDPDRLPPHVSRHPSRDPLRVPTIVGYWSRRRRPGLSKEARARRWMLRHAKGDIRLNF
jgi:hypothetical protein